MPRNNIKPTKTWDDVADTVDVKDVSEILGCNLKTATAYFKEKDFPLLDRIGLKADKTAARMYFQGFKIKQNPKLCIEQMIYMELQKNNKLLENVVKEKVTNEEN